MIEEEMNFQSYLDGMDEYIKNLQKLKEDNLLVAQKEAKESLERSGVLDEKGKLKKQICK